MKILKLLRTNDKIFELEKKIYKAYKMIIDGNEELKKRIEELERIVHNQPLIKSIKKHLTFL